MNGQVLKLNAAYMPLEIISWKDAISDWVKGKVEIISVPDFSTEREYRIKRKNGEIRWVYELIKNICDESGESKFVEGAI